jgi:hypothetical protein
MAALRDTLLAVLSTDRLTRQNNELHFRQQLEGDVNAVLAALQDNFMNQGEDESVRTIAGVLLRQTLEKYASKITSPVMQQLRSALLQMWGIEGSAPIMRRLGHVIAQSASKGDWSELLPFLLSDTTNQAKTPQKLRALLLLLETIAEYAPADVQTHAAMLADFLGQHVGSSDSEVQVACARAVCASCVALDDESSRNMFKPALQPVVNTLGACLTRGDEQDAVSVMEHLVEIAAVQPLFFKSNMDGVVAAMLTVAGAEDLDFATRSMALELMVTLAESAPALSRRCGGLVQNFVPVAMSVMLEVEEEEVAWVQGSYGVDAEDDNFLVGEEAIERAALGMGGRVLIPVVFATAQQFSAEADWKHRRAAVAAIVRLAEGATKAFKPHLVNSLNYLEQAIGDASPRVQYEAVQAFGRLSMLFPDATKDIVTRFVPLLVRKMEDQATCFRVRGHCASAMINLCDPEHCEAEVLEPYLSGLLNALGNTLTSAPMEVQAPCLVLLGCIAQVSEEAFAPFYGAFMPGVRQILESATHPSQMELRGKAMECAGLIGEAVGADTFSSDALAIMNCLITAMNSEAAALGSKSGSGDITFDYILPACARMSKALEARFVPFLSLVMSPLIVGATQEIKFSMEDACEEDQGEDLQRDDETGTESAVINMGAGIFKRVTLNTHAVQQKQQAASMLFDFAANLKEHLGGFLQPALQALLPMVTNKHSSDIRSAASLALGKVFEAYVHCGSKGIISPETQTTAMNVSIGKLVEALKGECNQDARAAAAEAMRDALQVLVESAPERPDGSRDGNSLKCKPDLQQAQEISTQLLPLCADALGRRSDKEQSFLSSEVLEEEDKESFMEEIEAEEDFIATIVDAIGQLLKLHGEAFMPYFDQAVAPYFVQFLDGKTPPGLQVISVCLIDDVLEYGGASGQRYSENCLSQFLQNLQADHAVLRQCSSYGIAQIAKHSPAAIEARMAEVLQSLCALSTAEGAREEDNEGATENCLFALGNMLAQRKPWNCSPVGRAQVGSMWLDSLPLRADELEAKMAHAQLCDAVECMDADIVGPQLTLLPRVLKVFADILGSAVNKKKSVGRKDVEESGLATEATMRRMRQLLSQIKGMLPFEAIESALNTLSADSRGVLAL